MSVTPNSRPSPETGIGAVIMRAEGITKRFGGTVALDQVNFNVYRGEVNALIGENGAGKSTLMKVLAGIMPPTAGRLLLDGSEVRFASAREAARRGIAIIHQELNLFPNLSVTDNIFMAREITRGRVWVDRPAQEELARRLMERLEHPIDPRALVGSLSLAGRQVVEIARALAGQVRILIMDEPASALSAAEVEVLFRIIRELREQGVSIVYISHRLEELLRIGDRVTVLRDGRLIAEERAGAVDVPWIIEKMAGRQPASLLPAEGGAPGPELLRVENLSLPAAAAGPPVDSVSFTLRRGEILGIYGLMGAGRTELLECLAGLRASAGGSIRLEGRGIERLPVAPRIEAGIVLVPEDRQTRGLVQTMSIRDNLTLAGLAAFTRHGRLLREAENAGAAGMIRDLAIQAPDAARPVTSLSGGNQQKVVLGKCLLTSPRVLLMDEPARGIDVGAKAEIYALMRRLAADGVGIVFVSSELKEVMAIAGRILVMARGRITGEFDGAVTTREALVAASAGGEHGRQ